MKSRITILLVLVMLCSCGPAIHTTDQQVLNCILLQNRQTYWGAVAKTLTAGAAGTYSIPWLSIAFGGFAIGFQFIENGYSSDYALYGCPTIKSNITTTTK